MRFIRRRFSGGQVAVLIVALACFLASRASAHLPCQVGMWTENDQICVGETADIWVITEECDSLSYSQYFFTASSTGVFTISNQCQSCSNGPSTGYLNIYVSALTGVTPSTASVCPGSSMTFTALDNSGTLECEPAWTVSPTNAGTVSTNGPTATFTLAPTPGSGSVTLSASCGTTTESATITVDSGEAFAITTQPSSQMVCPDSDVTLSVRATGNALSYQWRFNGVNLSDGRRFTGCTSSNLTISNVFTSVSACLAIPTDNHGGVEPCMVAPGDTYTYWAEGCTTFDANFTNLTVDPSGTIYVTNCTVFVGPPEVAPAGQGFAAAGLTAWSLVGEVHASTNAYYFQLGTNGTFQVPPSVPGFWHDLLLILNTGPTIHGNQGSWTGCVTHTVEGLYDCIVSSDCGSQISTTATLSVGTPCTTVIPTNRLIDWTQAGVPGGIPLITNLYMNLTSTNTVDDIQDALDSCPSGSYVHLGAGIFTLTKELLVRKSGIVMRGSTNTTLVAGGSLIGNGSDFLVNVGSMETALNEQDGYCIVGTSTNNGTYASFSNSWVLGYTQGTTNITLQDASSVYPGMIIGLDQNYDGTNVIVGTDGLSGTWHRDCGARLLQETKLVTAVNGNVVTIWPGLYSPYWSSNRNPAAFWNSTNAEDYVSFSGVEDMAIDASNQTKCALNIGVSYGCWARNVTFVRPKAGEGCANAETQFAMNWEIRHCVFTDQPLPPGSGNYAFEPQNSSAGRLEDNIFTNYYNAVQGVAICGNVFAYNYFTNDQSTACYAGSDVDDPTGNMFPHGGHCEFNLYEGNYARHLLHDALKGNTSYSAAFRNRFMGWEPHIGAACTNPVGSRAIRLERYQYYFSGVGNILGTTNHSVLYEGPLHNTYGDAIWDFDDYLGYGGPPEHNNDARVNDPRVTNTLFREGNWDVISGSNVWRTVTPQPITNSLAYPSMPSWWTNECANCPWPAYDPDRPTTAFPTNIPAGARFFKQGT